MRPLNFTVRRTPVVLMTQYRCQLERLGAPHWACAVGGTILALIIVGSAVIISASLSRRPGTPSWALPLIWSLGLVGTVLAVRSVRMAFRSESNSGVEGRGGAGPSNNRWRGP
jgi:cobalamin biosynthesis protein CobD/CbiB